MTAGRLLDLVRGAAIAVSHAIEAADDGDLEYARELLGIIDSDLARALDILTRKAAA